MKRDIYQTIANRIHTARIQKGLTQAEVAEKLQISAVAYGSYERAGRQISIDTLYQLADIFGRKVTWLLGIPDELNTDETDLIKSYREATPERRIMAKFVLTVK